MAYIRSRDGHIKPSGPLGGKEKEAKKKRMLNMDDIYDGDLDGEDELRETEQDRIFQKKQDTEFPLSGGETDNNN